MTTTTSTTSSTSSTSSAISTATQQLLTSLGSGSGIDTGTLVTSLVSAEFATRTDALTTKASTLTTQISGVASIKSAVTNFSTALATLSKGGTLTTQPTSSNTGVLTATALSGAKLSGLSSSVTVSQLAQAQAARTTTAVADRTATIGSGTFTLTLGTASVGSDGTMSSFTAGSADPVTIDVTDASLDGIAAAINAKKAGVTAAVVTDADGSAYLSLKGTTGAAQAFTLAATTDTSGKLAQFAVGAGATGTTITAAAQNAKLTVDGISVERASNSVSDLVSGVQLQLAGTSTTAVTLGSSTPTSALSQAVTDVVDSYNEVLSTITGLTDATTGALRSDPAAQALLRSFKGLASKVLLSGAASGTPTSLSEIGVATNRDGTLKVNSDTLANALATWPDSVEAMFATTASSTATTTTTTTSTDGLPAALAAIATTAADTTYGLDASTARYTAAQTQVSEDQDTLTTKSTAETTRLTQQFASMNTKVAAYKSTQTFLTNQIAAWNKSDS